MNENLAIEQSTIQQESNVIPLDEAIRRIGQRTDEENQVKALPLDEAIKQVGGKTDDDDQRQKDLTSWRAANSDVAQDKAADVYKMAKARPDLPLDFINNNYEDLKKQISQEEIRNNIQNAPGLAKFMQDPAKADMVKSDTASLSTLEWLVTGRNWTPGSGSWVPPFWYAGADQGLQQQNYNYLSNKAMLGVADKEDWSKIDKFRITPQEDLVGGMFKNQIGGQYIANALVKASQMVPYVAGSIISRVAGSAIGGYLTEGGGAKAGGFVGGQAWDFFQLAGPTYVELRKLEDEKGNPLLTHEQAQLWAVGSSFVTSAITSGIGGELAKQPVGKILGSNVTGGLVQAFKSGPFKAAMNALEQWSQHIVGGSAILALFNAHGKATEQMAKAANGQHVSTDEVVQAAADGFKEGLKIMPFLTAWSAGTKFTSDVGRYGKLIEHKASGSALEQVLNESSTIKENPEIAEEAVKEMLKQNPQAAPRYYVDFNEFNNLYKEEARNKATNILGDEGKTYDDAAKSGGSFVIPTEKFLTRLGGTEDFNKIYNISKTNPDEVAPFQEKELVSSIKNSLKEIQEFKPETAPNRIEEAAKLVKDQLPPQIDKTPEDAWKEELDKAKQEISNRIAYEKTQRNKLFIQEEYKADKQQAKEDLIKQEPVYRAISFFQTGKFFDEKGDIVEMPRVKLNIEALPFETEKTEKGFTRKIYPTQEYPRGIFEKDGVSPDILAPIFGFKDGDALLEAMRNSMPDDKLDKAADTIAQEKMYQKYGMLRDNPQELTGAILDQLYGSTDVVKNMIREVRMLRDQMASHEFVNAPTVPEWSQKQKAIEFLQTQQIADILPRRYFNEMMGNANRAFTEMRAKQVLNAHTEKEQQIGAYYKWMESKWLQERYEKLYDQLKDKTSEKLRVMMGKADYQMIPGGPSVFRDASDALLDSIGIKDRNISPYDSAKAVQSFEAWLNNSHIDLPYKSDLVQEALIKDKSWKQLTPEQAENVFRAISSIQAVARDQLEIKVSNKLWNINEARDALAKDLLKLPTEFEIPAGKPTLGEKVENGLQAYEAMKLIPQVVFDEAGSTWKKTFHDEYINARNEAQFNKLDWFNYRNAERAKVPDKIWNNLDKEISALKNLLPAPKEGNVKSIRSMGDLLQALRYFGTNHSRNSLVEGFGWTEENFKKAIGQFMPKELVDYVQKEWNYMEKNLWPKEALAYERRTGVPLEKSEALPFSIDFADGTKGKYDGGYASLKYSQWASKAKTAGIFTSADEQFTTVLGRLGSYHSYLQSRVPGAVDIADLDYRNFDHSVFEMLHDLAFDPYIRDMQKILQSDDLKKVMVEKLGPNKINGIEDFINTVNNTHPNNTNKSANIALKILGAVRSQLLNNIYGYSLTVGAAYATHPVVTAMLGSPLIPKAGREHFVTPFNMAAAFGKMLVPGQYSEMRDFALKNSGELPNRASNNEINLYKEMQSAGVTDLDAAKKKYEEIAFAHFGWIDKLVSTGTWTAKYRQELAKGFDEKTAANKADDLVRLSLPSKNKAELPPMLRDKAHLGLLFMAFSYWSRVSNMEHVVMHDPRMSWAAAQTPGEKLIAGSKLTQAFAGMLAGAATAKVIGGLAGAHGKMEDETWAEYLERTAIAAPFVGVPLVSQLADVGAYYIVHGKQGSIFGPSAPDISALQRLGNMAYKVFSGKSEDWERFVAGIQVAMQAPPLYGIGASQFGRTAGYVASGDAKYDLEHHKWGEFLAGVQRGPRRKHGTHETMFTVGAGK